MLKADLHVHSTISDGSVSIPELADIAYKKGIDLIAITDHDTLSHKSQIPVDASVKIIAGIEISAIDRRNELRAHILGYGIQEPDIVSSFTQPLLEARHNNSIKQIAILKEQGFFIDIKKLNKADGKYIYKQHIMEHLVSTGQAEDMFGSFYKYTFKNGGACAFDIEYADVFEAVTIVKQAGGKAVLAHSGQQKNFYIIPELIECGLDGLEYNHHANNYMSKEIIRDYARKYGLFLTGGSDFHGIYEEQVVDIGDYISEESGIKAIC